MEVGMESSMQILLEKARLIFGNYERGSMLNNCDPQCCPNGELNSALVLPLSDIQDDDLWAYYHYGPNGIGELADYKFFLPTFAERISNDSKYWDPWWLASAAVDRSHPTDWTNDEIHWLIEFFEKLAEQQHCKKLCNKTIERLRMALNSK